MSTAVRRGGYCRIPSSTLQISVGIVHRIDHGLQDADRAIDSPHIAPVFEEMRLRNVPVAQDRSFVKVRADVKDGLRFFQTFD